MLSLFRDSEDCFSSIKSIEEIIKVSVDVRVGLWLKNLHLMPYDDTTPCQLTLAVEWAFF